MESLAFASKEYLSIDKKGNKRWFGTLPNKRQIKRSQLVMMNFLHTAHIPTAFDVHHKDGNTENDTIDNLQLLSNKQHAILHHPRDYKYGVSRAEDSPAYDRAVRRHPETRAKILASDRRSYLKKKDDPHFKEVKKKYGRGYIAMKRATDPVFKEQQLEYTRIWCKSHKEEIAKLNKDWREKQKDDPGYMERERIRKRKHYQENKEKINIHRKMKKLNKKMEAANEISQLS